MIHYLVEASLVCSTVSAYFLGRYRHKPRYQKHPLLESHLRFGFTLDGVLTGEEIPEGINPSEAARERSEREKKRYGACRI